MLVARDGAVLCAQHLESADDKPPGLVSSQEEEPWWRLLGCALSGVESADEGERLRLQFEAGGPEPRVVTLAREAEGVRCELAAVPR